MQAMHGAHRGVVGARRGQRAALDARVLDASAREIAARPRCGSSARSAANRIWRCSRRAPRHSRRPPSPPRRRSRPGSRPAHARAAQDPAHRGAGEQEVDGTIVLPERRAVAPQLQQRRDRARRPRSTARPPPCRRPRFPRRSPWRRRRTAARGIALVRARRIVPRRAPCAGARPAACRRRQRRVRPRRASSARTTSSAPRTSPGLNSAHSLARTRSGMRLPCARHTRAANRAVVKLYGTRGADTLALRRPPRARAPPPVEKYSRDASTSPRVSRARKRTALPSYASEWLIDLAQVARRIETRRGCVAVQEHGRLGLGARVALAQRGCIAALRNDAAEAGDDRLRRCVLAAVEGEAAVQLGLDAVNHRQEAIGGEIVDKAQRGALRADRVRRRGTRPDAIQLERADVHRLPPEETRHADCARSSRVARRRCCERKYAKHGVCAQRTTENRCMVTAERRDFVDYKLGRREPRLRRIRQALRQRRAERSGLLVRVLPPFRVEQIGDGTRDEGAAHALVGQQERRELLGKHVVRSDRIPHVARHFVEPAAACGMRRNRQSVRYSISS